MGTGSTDGGILKLLGGIGRGEGHRVKWEHDLASGEFLGLLVSWPIRRSETGRGTRERNPDYSSCAPFDGLGRHVDPNQAHIKCTPQSVTSKLSLFK